MMIKKVSDEKKIEISVDGVRGVSKQQLISMADGAPVFTMRRFTVKPGGYTFHHTHDFEHEVYVLEGKGVVFKDGQEVPFYKDYVIFVEPNEIHQFKNTGDDDLVFLCIIPNTGEK